MASPAILLGLAAVGGVGAGTWQSKAALEDPQLKPTLMGMPASVAVPAMGVAMALFGPAWMAAMGIGAAIGSAVSTFSTNSVRKGLQAQAAREALAPAEELPPAPVEPPAQLPGPAPAPPVDLTQLLQTLVPAPAAS